MKERIFLLSLVISIFIGIATSLNHLNIGLSVDTFPIRHAGVIWLLSFIGFVLIIPLSFVFVFYKNSFFSTFLKASSMVIITLILLFSFIFSNYNRHSESHLKYFEGLTISSCQNGKSLFPWGWHEVINRGPDECLSMLFSVDFLGIAESCDLISDAILRDRCYFDDQGYGTRAFTKRDYEKYCDKIGNEQLRNTCNDTTQARSSNCAGIKNNLDRYLCHINRGDSLYRNKWISEDQCLVQQTTFLRDYCYFNVVDNAAQETNGQVEKIELCEKIVDLSMRQDCKIGWSELSGQPDKVFY